jgi:drug/metabolite transporter (DMT)-like permease
MKRIPLHLFSCLTVLDTTAFVLDKIASTHADAAQGPFYLQVVTQPWIWLAFAIGPLQLWTWNKILARIDLSLAYPLTTISYLATMLVSQFIFHESLGPRVWAGAVLITLGVAVLGKAEEHRPMKAEERLSTNGHE